MTRTYAYQKKTGTYIVVYGEPLMHVTSLDWSARHSGWNLSDDIMSRRNEICGIRAWAEMPSIDEIREELNREE
jgi:hypothetical protein